jgi:preprotein translocase subunit SecE
MEKTSLAKKVVARWNPVKEFFKDLHSEMRRVTWPNRKQVRATTVVVIVAVFAFAAYFAVVDFALGRTITKVFDLFTRT